MQKIIQIFSVLMLTTAVFSCGGGGGSDPAPLNAKYIDPSQGTNGTGTESSPYNTFAGLTFEAGTSYLIKRGTVLYEQITVDDSGTASAPIIIGAYGTGEPPVIDGSELTGDSSWQETSVGSGIYYQDFTIDLLNATGPIGPGNVSSSNSVIAMLKFKDGGTPSTGEYTISSSGRVQIYDAPVASLRVSRRYFGIKGSNVSYVTIKDLHIRQASLHGIHFEDSSNITVQNCKIEMCGGAYIGTLQAGNGVEFGNSSSICSVIGCTISEIFDSGVTCQTYDNNQAASDFIFSDNTISKCGFAGVEVAVLRNIDKSGSSISGVSVATSTITSCGDGFSGVRYGNEGRGIKIKADDGAGTLSGVSVEQCTVESSEAGVFVSGNTDDVIIKRCKFASNGYGVVAYDVQASSTLKIAVQSSLFLANSIGFGFHVAHGNGFELYNNTFIDNTLCGIGVSAHSGIAKIKNNILYSSSVVRQFESIALTSAEINYNCYTSGAGFI